MGSAQAVDLTRHLDVHDDEVGLHLAGHLDGAPSVAGLPDDVVPQILEHLTQVKSRQRLVFSDHDPSFCPSGPPQVPSDATFGMRQRGNDTTARTPSPSSSRNSPFKSSRASVWMIWR